MNSFKLGYVYWQISHNGEHLCTIVPRSGVQQPNKWVKIKIQGEYAYYLKKTLCSSKTRKQNKIPQTWIFSRKPIYSMKIIALKSTLFQTQDTWKNWNSVSFVTYLLDEYKQLISLMVFLSFMVCSTGKVMPALCFVTADFISSVLIELFPQCIHFSLFFITWVILIH